MRLCDHKLPSKCNFWITFTHFPLNFISSVRTSESAGQPHIPNAWGVCGHCSSFLTTVELSLIDNTTDSLVLPVQTQTELAVCFAALIMHVTVPGERKEKGKPGEY